MRQAREGAEEQGMGLYSELNCVFQAALFRQERGTLTVYMVHSRHLEVGDKLGMDAERESYVLEESADT